MKDETQKAREILEKKILEKKQNNNELILENLRETIEKALEAMNLTELHKILRDNSKFSGSKMMLANWLDAQGIRKKRPVAADVTAARVKGRKAAKAARAAAVAEQPKEQPKPAPATERPAEQPKPAPAAEQPKETPKPAPEQVAAEKPHERPVGNPVSVWGDSGPRCPECSRRIQRHQNKEGYKYWLCEHCNNVFADNDGKIGEKYLKRADGSYYLPSQE